MVWIFSTSWVLSGQYLHVDAKCSWSAVSCYLSMQSSHSGQKGTELPISGTGNEPRGSACPLEYGRILGNNENPETPAA